MENWAERFLTQSWKSVLRKRVYATRGNLSNVDELVDDMLQDVLEKIARDIDGKQSIEISNSYFITKFDWVLNDNYRRIKGHIRPPQAFIDNVSDRDLANDVFKQVCLLGNSQESATGHIKRLTELGKRQYPFDAHQVAEAVEFIKSNGICQPPRSFFSIDGSPDEDEGDGGNAVFEPLDEGFEPDIEESVDQGRQLVQMLLASQADQVSESFEDLHRRFLADEVIDDEQRMILRLQFSTGEKVPDDIAAGFMDMKSHTLRRRRTKALNSIREWLETSGFGFSNL